MQNQPHQSNSFSSNPSSNYHSDTSDYPSPSNNTEDDQIELGCNDTCCKLVNVLSKSQQAED